MELFGYDFMIDSKFNTWLIEVNSSPSMEYSTVLNIFELNFSRKLLKKLLSKVWQILEN